MASLSPFKKKPKWVRKLFGISDDEINVDMLDQNVQVLEVIHTMNWKLFKTDDDMKIIELLMKNFPGYVGDNVVEIMGQDIRGKSRNALVPMLKNVKDNDKVTMKLLRVNSPKIFLKTDVKVIFILFCLKIHE